MKEIVAKRFINTKSSLGVSRDCVIRFKDDPDNYRARSEMIILRITDDQDIEGLFDKSQSGRYIVPGGSLDFGESEIETAIRETNEEALIKVSSVKLCGERFDSNPEISDWVRENVAKEWQWNKFYTTICCGLYDGKYRKFVKPIDKDNFYYFAKWYNLAWIWDDIIPEYRAAINKYILSL